MTTTFKKNKTCFICGEVGTYTGIGSTYQSGPPDLDTRPPELKRSTINHWIHRCPSCGYCAPDISDGSEIAGKVIKSDPYLHQRDDDSYPDLANKFLCWAIIQEAIGVYNGAGVAALRAAWACDDAKADSGAVESRKRALSLFEQARANGMSFADGLGVEEALLADLLRRIGHFDEVEAVCQSGLVKRPEAIVEKILLFQQTLAYEKDTGCYTVAEASEFAKSQ